MKVLLRNSRTGLFFQSSGDWDSERSTAREFLSASVAYWWAVDKHLVDTEVVVAFDEPSKDFVVMHVNALSSSEIQSPS